jgi:uncharacterized membrane protein
MGRASEAAIAALPAAGAERLWTDTARWPTFVDGFSRVIQLDPRWPEIGSKVVWQSVPAGRGRVTERVRHNVPGRFVTQVYEDRLTGTQTVEFEAVPDGAAVRITLEYSLQKGGPFRAIADAIFIRRALSDALARTLRRFATEAAEEASL